MALNSRQTLKLLLGAAVFVLVFKMLWSRSADAFGDDVMEPETYEEGEFESYDDDTEEYRETYEDAGEMETYADDEEAYGDETETYADISATAAPKPSKALTQVATDLLPRRGGAMTGGDNWGEFAPKNALKNQNFLDAKKFIGVDTQGSALKNANYDIRSSMPIPKSEVGPWMGSSVDPDLMRRPLE
jgi:hypothetical protein